jgi:hypothetical protein
MREEWARGVGGHCVHTHTHTRTRVQTHTHARAHMCKHTHAHVDAHTLTCASTHTHMWTPTHSEVWGGANLRSGKKKKDVGGGGGTAGFHPFPTTKGATSSREGGAHYLPVIRSGAKALASARQPQTAGGVFVRPPAQLPPSPLMTSPDSHCSAMHPRLGLLTLLPVPLPVSPPVGKRGFALGFMARARTQLAHASFFYTCST